MPGDNNNKIYNSNNHPPPAPKMIIILGMCRRSAQRWTSAAHVECGALRASLLLSAVDKILTIYS